MPRRPGSVAIVIPAKDEAEAIGATLEALPISTLEAEGHTVRVVVLDGRSRDGTAAIARLWGAEVFTDRGRGKAAAVRDIREHLDADYVVMIDADGSYAADAIPRVLDALTWGEADIVMGDRRPLPGSMTAVHKVGNAALSLEASILYGRFCPDLCTGLWGFCGDILQGMPLQSQGFELEADLFALASRLRLRIGHVPVDYLPRTGETKLSATRDGMRIGWWLVRTRFARIPAATRPSARPSARPAQVARRPRPSGLPGAPADKVQAAVPATIHEEEA